MYVHRKTCVLMGICDICQPSHQTLNRPTWRRTRMRTTLPLVSWPETFIPLIVNNRQVTDN